MLSHYVRNVTSNNEQWFIPFKEKSSLNKKGSGLPSPDHNL